MTALSDETARALLHADVVIGGLPFHLAIDDEHPYQRQTMPWKRQQIDTSNEPGEQTFSQYWVRDQDSWHRGAGINFYEPGTDPFTRYRFASSTGVDVWQAGDLTLLHAMSRVKTAASGDVGVCSVVRNAVNGVYYTVGGGLGFYSSAGTATDFTMGGLAAASEPVIAGSKVLFGLATGVGAADVNNENATITTLWTVASGAVVRPWWVKSRIIAARGASLYELTLAGGALPAALYTHPDSNWVWTSVTETPDAILCAGRSNGHSAIYALTLATSGTAGATPTLGPMAQVAEFPPGEEVHAIMVYLGSFLAIGTTHGVRIAEIGSGGQLRYGPLTVESTYPVRCLAMRDSFVYAGIEYDIADSDGHRSGCVRINLAEEITNYVNGLSFNSSSTSSTLRFAWANDVMMTAATIPVVNSIAFLGTTDRVALGGAASGVWAMSSTLYVSVGNIISGQIRYGTTEQKMFPWIRLRCELPDDDQDVKIDVLTVDSAGTTAAINTYRPDSDESIDVPLTPIQATPQVSLGYQLYLWSSNTSHLNTPTVHYLSLKAVPRPALQREISFPLRLNDREESRNGSVFGYRGWAYARLTALEDLQADNVIMTITDNTTGESFSGLVEDVRVVRNTPPSRTDFNYGGIVQVTVIKL